MDAPNAPRISGVLEACLYADDLEAGERFYAGTLGLRAFARQSGRHVFFHTGGRNVFLLFNPAGTRATHSLAEDSTASVPPHGTVGPGHVAFAIAEADIDSWSARLTAAGVAIEADITWPRGGRSLYVRDPAGNSVELASPRIWSLP